MKQTTITQDLILLARNLSKAGLKKYAQQIAKFATDPAVQQGATQEVQSFADTYINLGEQSPFYDNAAGIGLAYKVAPTDILNYQFQFKLNEAGKLIPNSIGVAPIPSEGKVENKALTQQHYKTLQKILSGIDWVTQYPNIVAMAKEFSSFRLGPFNWTGEVFYTGGEIDMAEGTTP